MKPDIDDLRGDESRLHELYIEIESALYFETDPVHREFLERYLRRVRAAIESEDV